jgi:hypothetical protein
MRQYKQIGKAYKVSSQEGVVFKLAIDLSLTEFKKLLRENEDVKKLVKKINTNRYPEGEDYIELSLVPLRAEYQNTKKQYILEIQYHEERITE